MKFLCFGRAILSLPWVSFVVPLQQLKNCSPRTRQTHNKTTISLSSLWQQNHFSLFPALLYIIEWHCARAILESRENARFGVLLLLLFHLCAGQSIFVWMRDALFSFLEVHRLEIIHIAARRVESACPQGQHHQIFSKQTRKVVMDFWVRARLQSKLNYLLLWKWDWGAQEFFAFVIKNPIPAWTWEDHLAAWHAFEANEPMRNLLLRFCQQNY